MKRNQIVGVGMLLALAATTGLVYAGTDDVVTAKVPYEFTVGDKVMPKGDYEFFAADPQDPAVWTARLTNGKVEDTFATDEVDAQSENGAPQTEVVFDEIGQHYFLRQLWVDGESIGREIPPSKAERELEKQGTPKRQHHLSATHSPRSTKSQQH